MEERPHYNHKERKNLAKALGLKKKDESHQEWSERVRRSQQAGEQIHQQFIMNAENKRREEAAEKEAKIYQNWVDLYGEERAKSMLENNRAIEEKRRLKLLKRIKKEKTN